MSKSSNSKHADTSADIAAKNGLWWRRLLSSPEERASFHVHKVLGITALLSFVYRYANMSGGRDGNFGPYTGTLFFIGHHFLLNASSFIFDIPARRMKGGFRIWPEYRIHSLVFATRSLAGMLLIWFEQIWKVEKPYYLCNVAIVLLTCAAADYGSSLQKYPSPTVRGTHYPSRCALLFASQQQFIATAFSLIGIRRYTQHLTFLTIIQINAFLMTLQRKNLASPFLLGNCYGALLLGGIIVGIIDDQYSQILWPAVTVGNVAILLRLGPLHVNKYVVWTMLGGILHIIRVTDYVEVENNLFWAATLATTFVSVTIMNLWMNRLEVAGLLDWIKTKVPRAKRI